MFLKRKGSETKRYRQSLMSEGWSFEFRPDVLVYGSHAPGGSFKARIPYIDIPLQPSELEVKLNTGWFLAIAILLAFSTALTWRNVATDLNTIGYPMAKNALFFAASALLLAAAIGSYVLLSIEKVTFTIFSTSDYDIMILKSISLFKLKKHDLIFDELTTRRNAEYKKFAVIEPFEHEASAYQRFKRLKEMGIISDNEFELLVAKLSIHSNPLLISDLPPATTQH